jgi:hypothetical protein
VVWSWNVAKAEDRSRARDLLRAVGLEEQVGYLGRHMSVDQAICELGMPP